MRCVSEPPGRPLSLLVCGNPEALGPLPRPGPAATAICRLLSTRLSVSKTEAKSKLRHLPLPRIQGCLCVGSSC